MPVLHQLKYLANSFLRYLVNILLIFGMCTRLVIGQFSEATLTYLDTSYHPGFLEAELVWGDFNYDGRGDLFVSGISYDSAIVAQIYLANTSNILELDTVRSLSFIPLSDAQSSICDIDNDGNPDLFYTGIDSLGNYQVLLYTFDGDQFEQNVRSTQNVIPLINGDSEWADYDHDGDQDLLILGSTKDGQPATALYKNNSGILVSQDDINTTIYQLSDGSVSWVDANKDNSWDFIISGYLQNGLPLTELYLNNDDGSWQAVGASGLPNLGDSNMDIVDYDNDGDEDVLISGIGNDNSGISAIYENNGLGIFSQSTLIDTNVYQQIYWGDFTEDGRSDVLLWGKRDSIYTLSIYSQVPSQPLSFTSLIVLDTLDQGSVVVIDGEKNGTLDILLTGRRDSVFWRGYANDAVNSTIPVAPQNLLFTQIGTKGIFTWNNINEVNYSFYLKEIVSNSYLYSTLADTLSGYRRTLNVDRNYRQGQWSIDSLPEGSYTFGIQAIDRSREASAFSRINFRVQPLSFSDQTTSYLDPTLPGLKNTRVTHADVDLDGDLDLAFMGENEGSIITQILYNEIQATPKYISSSINVLGLTRGDMSWDDYDLDNDLDLLICGWDGTQRRTLLYQNNVEAGTFTQTDFSFIGVDSATISWGDYDNDGDSDILLTGFDGTTWISELYENDLQGFTRTPIVNTLLNEYSRHSAKWVDYDRDGDLDIWVTGLLQGVRRSQIIQNDGGVLSQSGIPNLNGVPLGQIEVADFNLDNYPDILLVGSGEALLYKNISAGTFALVNTGLTGLDLGSASWGDYDNDEDPDLIFTGSTNSADTLRKTLLYKNQGNDTFLEDVISSSQFPQLGGGSVASWLDVNNNRELDLVLSGKTDSGLHTFVYVNLDMSTPTDPGIPTQLNTKVLPNGDIKFTWQPPDIGQAYTYNLFITTTVLGADVKSPSADINSGERWVKGLGNVGNANSWIWRSPSPGDYVWSVQAIDQDFEGSSFANPQFFSIKNPEFSIDSSFNIPGLSNATASWGDLDCDGDLDLAILGGDGTGPFTGIYRHEENHTFSLINFVLPQMSNGDIDWGDYNNDGYLDLILSGIGDTGGETMIYKNDANGNLAQISDNLLDVFDSSVEWGDYDNDGDLDILITGVSSGRSWTKVYRNESNDQFVDIEADFDTIRSGNATFGDYDNDNDLDILMSGNRFGSVYENQEGVFVKKVFLRKMINSDAEWGDYNNDGFLDVFLSGLETENGGDKQVIVYRNVPRNDGTRSFQQVVVLPGLENGDLSLGDYTGDGWLDILVSGSIEAQDYECWLFKQINGQFVLDSLNTRSLSDIGNGSISNWADINADGKLDLLLTGQKEDGSRAAELYYNELGENTFSFGSPGNLISEQVNRKILLQWEAPPEGNPDRYTYALYVGNQSQLSTPQGAISIKNPHSDLSTGARKVVKWGEISQTSYTIDELVEGTYYWSVQAIDKDFSGSSFFTEQSFDYKIPNFIADTASNFENNPPGLSRAIFSWVDYDTDGDLDFLLAGLNNAGQPTMVMYSNQEDNSFRLINSNFPDVYDGDVAWADYDHDGDPDVLITGNSTGGPITRLYQNDLGVFNEVNTNFEPLSESSVAWGDLDNDGDKDLILIGRDENGVAKTILYRNESFTEFVEIKHSIENIYSGDVAWGDYDRDGDFDLILSGLTNQDVPFSRLYRNNFGLFEEINPGFKQLAQSSVAWGDYNNDGLLDLLMAGRQNPSFTQIYRNLGNDAFQEIVVDVEAVSSGEVSWGDYNNDGYRDFLITGTTEEGQGFAKIYRNQQGLGFNADENSSILLPQLGEGSIGDWADVDGDGKIDVFISGKNLQNGLNDYALLKNNLNIGSSLLLPPPQQVNAQQVGDILKITWEPPSGYDADLVDGLTYAISLVPTNTGIPPLISESDPISGILYIPNNASNFNTTEISIQGLSTGEYELRVQAISSELVGSVFSDPVNVQFQAPELINVTGTIFTSSLDGIDNGESSWADVDGDGDSDLLIQGLTAGDTPITQLFLNENGSLILDNDASNVIVQVDGGSMDWGDYDNDGDVDLLICGISDNGSVTKLYTNTNGVFEEVAFEFTGVFNSDVKGVDIDRDGWLDISIIGNDGINKISKIYRNQWINNPSEPFEEINGLNIAIDNGSQAWTDVDKDGDRDVLLIGERNGGVPVVSLRLNDGQGNFSAQTGTGILALGQASAFWGELNNDGWPDLLVSGIAQNGEPVTIVYQNNQDYTFTGIEVAKIGGGDAFWGDWDEDGDWDITVLGDTLGGGTVSALFINENGTYNLKTEDSEVIEAVEGGAFLSWGDINKNGYPDLLVGGRDNMGEKVLILYQNTFENIDPKPRKPPVPANLNASQVGNSIVFSWEKPNDISYPSNLLDGLSYNVYVGLEDGDQNIQTSNSDPSTGNRYIIGRGNASQTLSWTFDDLPDATYRWGVQAIDADYEGSEFVQGEPVIFERPDWRDDTESILLSALNGIAEAEMHSGDYNSDGATDLLIMGTRNGQAFTSLYRNLAQNGQFQIINSSLPAVSNAAFDWGDYNGDGFIDLVYCGNVNGIPQTRVYINNNGIDFTNSGNNLDGVQNGDVVWLDYDNDGDLDILYMGESATGPITSLYENQSGNFIPIENDIPGLRNGSIATADYNNDGYIDFFITGTDGLGAVSRLYKNVAGSTFQVETVNIQNFQNSHSSWVDYDNDGDQDLFISGRQGGNLISRLYRNDIESNEFVSITLNIPAVSDGEIIWADLDFDGFKDVIITGEGDSGKLFQIYINDTEGDFTLDDIGSGVFNGGGLNSDVSVGDFDGNGVIDICLIGTVAPDNSLNIVLNQLSALSNISPGVPGNLSSRQRGRSVILDWNPPENGNPAISPGYTYNIFIGTDRNIANVKSPHASITSGDRWIYADGNLGSATQFELNELESGKYFWSIQSISQDYEASEFAGIDSFEYVNPVLLDSTERIFVNLPEGFTDASLAWGDYNNDNLLDLVVSGMSDNTRVTRLYRSDGKQLFNSGITTFANVSQGSLEWDDFNLDGNLDLLLTGMSDGGPVSKIYRNNGNETFTEVDELAGISNGEAKWGDCDNDGDPDIIISGLSDNDTPITQLYKNDNGNFIPDNSSDLADVSSSTLAWQDYNVDGFLDLFLAGTNTSGFPITRIYLNNTLGVLENTGQNFDNVSEGDIDWGDFNNDGLPDILVTGTIGSGPLTRVYLNNGGTSFTPFFEDEGGINGTVAWGDYNNDGYRDFLVIGSRNGQSEERIGKIYRNMAGTDFEFDEDASVLLEGVSNGDAAWADYDKDGLLDLIIAGSTQDDDGLIRFFQNEINATPSIPEIPRELKVEQSGDQIIFTWNAPQSSNPSAINGYTYNIFVNTNGENIISPLSDESGYRRIAKAGNAYYRRKWVLEGLEEGTYTWGVQSVDSKFEGSAFIDGEDFIYTDPDFEDITDLLLDDIPVISQGAMEWGDYNEDRRQDLIITGLIEGVPNTRLYRNENDGELRLSLVENSTLENVYNGDVAWGDYDNDGDLDIAISGQNTQGPFTAIYRNDEETFSMLDLDLVQVTNSALAWGDIDNDGDLDLIIAGSLANGSTVVRIYRNDRNDTFTNNLSTIPGMKDGSLAFGDYDGDLDLDILLTGDIQGTPSSQIWVNNGGGNFIQAQVVVNGIDNLQGVMNGSGSWGDYNNDGWLDILIAGASNGTNVLRVYVNNSNGTFTPIVNRAGLIEGEALWADVNNDNFLDIIMAGEQQSGLGVSIYLYSDDDNFPLDRINSEFLVSLKNGSGLALADLDLDGKLDLTVYGIQGVVEEGIFKIYRNINANQGNPLNEAPVGLTSVQNSEVVELIWQSPPGIPENIVSGLSYNIYIGRQSGDIDFQSPMADTLSGVRYVTRLGPVDGNRWRVEGLSAGRYYWSVQAIDQRYQGSPFAVESSFLYSPPDFIDETEEAFSQIPLGVTEADISWVDVTRDNQLDMFVTGASPSGRSSTLYRNTNGVFSEVETSLIDVDQGDADWADFDNNNTLDLALIGRSDTGFVFIIYRYQNNSFTRFQTLPGLSNGSVAWGDYNNDGLPDLLVTGESEDGTAKTHLYRNLIREFKDVEELDLRDVAEGRGVWGDINSDGWLDIILTGNTNTELVTEIYINDKQGGFDRIEHNLPGVEGGTVLLLDVNNNGLLDILLMGNTSGTPITNIYSNQGNNQFTLFDELNGFSVGEASWGDFNDDGFPDIALTGTSSDGATTILYRNLQGLNLEMDSLNSAALQDVSTGSSISWGDYNNDRKLDLAIAGGDPAGNGKNLILYRNVETSGNRRSGPPTNLRSIPSGEELRFTWSPPTGYLPEQVEGLTYNIYIGTSSNRDNTLSPESSIPNGFRRIIHQGNILDTTWTIKDLPSGTYFWSVQAIDPDFEGSRFAEEQVIEFSLPIYQEVFSVKDSLIGIDQAASSWGDFDNDGDLDLLAIGRSANANTAWVYRNLGNDTFQQVDFFLPKVRNGEVGWIDFDQDGFLDMIICGETSRGLITNIYRSDSANQFIDISAKLPGLRFADIDWGDFDNDGDIDIALCGVANDDGESRPISNVYLNLGGNNFTRLDLQLPGVSNGTIEWVDIDSDGRLDLFLSGNTANGSITSLRHNEGNNSFVELEVPFVSVGNSASDWGDYNNDGRPDLLIAGERSDGIYISYLYRNDDGLNFTGVDSLVGVSQGTIQWGDYNEDGFSDLLISGNTTNGITSRSKRIDIGISAIYENKAGQDLVLDSVNTPILTQIRGTGLASWVDYNDDGKLDVLIGGGINNDTLKVLTIFENIGTNNSDDRPLPPTLSNVVKGEDRVTLSWTPPGAGTGVGGYTYNLRLTDDLDTDNVVSSLSNIATGDRKIVDIGNVGSTEEWTIRDLPTGTYYWSVQAIDQEYESSAFAAIDSFDFVAARFIDVSDVALADSILGFNDGALDLGDYDNDEDLDLLISGVTDSGYVTALFENQGQSRFVKVDLNMTGVGRGDVAWGDINNDGWLDAVVTGTFDGNQTAAFLYVNVERNGERTLESVNTTLPGIVDGNIAWGDYNNDGFMDMLVMGFSSKLGIDISRVYRNNQNGNFGSKLEPLGGGLRGSSAAWGDYDSDGDLDVAITGSADIDKKTVIFENRFNEVQGNELVFREISSTRDSLVQVSDGTIRWGDYDNDGDLDLLICGEDLSGGLHTKIYENLGNGQFTEDKNANLPGIVDGEAIWGDYDEDGTMDVLLSGRNGPDENDRTTRLYIYNSFLSTFSYDNIASDVLQDVNDQVSIAFADYDRNGLLDIFIAGRADGPDTTRVFNIYQNKIGVLPNFPEPPIDLTVTEVRSGPDNTFELDLSWSPADSSVITSGYSYNLVFTSSGANQFIFPPMADTIDGFRRIVNLGNVNQNGSWTIKELPEGSYRWSVQSIDQSYQGSDFAAWAPLTLEIPSYEDRTNDVFETTPVGLANGSVSIGDVDNDEDLDFIITGEDQFGKAHSTLYIYSRTNTQYQIAPFSDRLMGVKRSGSDWADYDLDGDLDLLLSGADTLDQACTKIYRNLGGGNFVEDSVASNNLPQLVDASVDWGDFNNDGFEDILISGNEPVRGKITAVYRNEGNGLFTRLRRPFGPDSNQDFEAVDKGSVAWGDYNKDGHLDFIISGQDEEGDPFTAIYRNTFLEDEVDNQFSRVDLTNADVFDSSVDWGDVNNDGFLDVIISGFGGPTIGLITAIYIYEPQLGRFDPQTLPIPRLQKGSVFFGDYNFDGYRDILISGQTVDSTLEAQVIPNSGGMGFGQDLRSSSKLIGLTASSGVWGDLEEPDGKLDIIMSGVDESGNYVLKLYRNERTGRVSEPPLPTNLKSDDVGLYVELSWDPPQDYDSTLVDGLTYNIIVVRQRDTMLQVAPMADTVRGVRRVVRLGNAGHHTVWNLTQIPTGSYKWGIQVVDAHHEGGEFVFAEEEFSFTAPLPNIIDSNFAEFFPWGGDIAESWIEVQDTSLVREVRVVFSPISSLEEHILTLQREENRYTFPIRDNLPLMDPEGRMIGIDYYFEVRGRFATNEVRTDKKYTYIRFPEGVDDMNLTDNTLIRYGIDRSFYNILSIPLELTNTGIQDVLDELGPYDNKVWRMFHTMNDEYVEYRESESPFTDFEVGKGYWLIIGSTDGTNDVFPGEGTTVQVTETNPYVLTLSPGWNQIGNPYNFNISWNDVIDDDLNPGSSTELEELRTFKFALNSDADVLERFSGGIVMAHSEITLKVPVFKNPSAQRLSNTTISTTNTTINNPLHFANWRVRLSVESGGLISHASSFGMDRNAKLSRDPLDRMRMPRFDDPNFTYLDVSFHHPEYFYPYFSTDIIPTANTHIWDVTVSSNVGREYVKISWDNAYFGNGDKQLILFDVEKQKVIDMKRDSVYTSSSPKIDRPFRIYYGDQQFIDSVLTPDRIVLGEAYPNPFEEGIAFPFTLVEKGNLANEVYDVSLSIYNLLGQQIYKRQENQLSSGFQEFLWDGKHISGEPVDAGSYIYMIQVWDGEEQFQATGRIIKH